VQQRVERLGVDRGDRLRLVEQPLGHRVDREAHPGLRRALGVAGLQQVQPPLLHGELRVLHVAVVGLELRSTAMSSACTSGSHSRSSAMSRVLRTPTRRPRPARWPGSPRTARARPVISSRENATPDPDVSPLLPNTICCTDTAVPHVSGIRLMRR
jgi:hypothetical protein